MCKKSRGLWNKLPPLLLQEIPFFCLGCAHIGPRRAVKPMFYWCNAQDLVSKYLPGCGAVTMQRALNMTWNQSTFPSLGTLVVGGEKQKKRFATSKQDTERLFLNTLDVIVSKLFSLQIVLAKGFIKPLTETWIVWLNFFMQLVMESHAD